MKNKIAELLGIRYPILLGGLQWISRASLVAAVTNAGGGAFLTAASFSSASELREEIRRTRELTDALFGVNISMLPESSPGELAIEFAYVAADEKIPYVETSGRLPVHLLPVLKSANIRTIHKVATLKHAKKAEAAGVDAVVVVGAEGGGHPGMDQVGTFVKLPAVVDELKIPVIAAGGICDRRTYLAALVLGAEGVMMGTRWLATEECPVHPNIKEWIVNAQITDTILIQQSLNNPIRAIDNAQARKVLAMEQAGAGLEELLPFISGKLGRSAMENGQMEAAVLTSGQCAGRIHKVLTVQEVINELTL